MKNFIAGILVCFSTAVAEAQSIGFLMHDADLVVAGETVAHGQSGRVDLYSLNGCEVIKGVLDQADFKIACFCDVCCHVHLHSGMGSLMFLRRLTGNISGVNMTAPMYTILNGELGHINYEAEEENAVLDIARRYASIPDDASANDRAEAVADIFKASLRLDSEPLLYSAAYDVVATPGALDRLSASDETLALEKFRSTGASSRLRGRMLLLLGETAPAGFIPLLEDVVRSQEGRFYLEPSAAILGAIGDAGSGFRLINGFSGLGEIEQSNIIYVLGHMGNGKGLSALETLLEDFAEPLCLDMVDALVADRTDTAVNLLTEMSGHSNSEVAMRALIALGRINTTHARNVLRDIAGSSDMDEAVVEKAAEILGTLSE
ncbi:MAG: HEAT repeat domain-containing protein [Planctomycetota bacterium]